MVLLGSKAPKRNVEQHDFFFGIAHTLKYLVPELRLFWPEAGNSIHIDGWREVTMVEGFSIKPVVNEKNHIASSQKLFFINLGGYQSNILEEQHYTVLNVHKDKAQAVQQSMKTVFYKTNTIKGARSHIDEKYGIDVDNVYAIEDILPPLQKQKFRISILPATGSQEDIIHLGYLKLHNVK